MWKSARAGLALLAVSVTFGCSDQPVAPSNVDNLSARRVDLPGGYCGSYTNPGSVTITVGQSTSISAWYVDCVYGAVNPLYTGYWTTGSSSIASISGSGGWVDVYGVAPGTVNVTHYDGIYSAQATVTVVAAPYLSSMIVSAENNIALGGTGNTTQLSAAGRDQFNQPIATGTVTWSTSDANIATVTSSGFVTFGSGVGNATITATVGSVSANITVTANVLWVSQLFGWTPTHVMVSSAQTIDFHIETLGGNSGVTYQWYYTDWTSSRQTLGTNYFQAIDHGCSGSGVPFSRWELVEVDVTYMGQTTNRSQWLYSEYWC